MVSEPSPNLVTNGCAITATALANAGFGFRSWEGTILSDKNPLDFVLDTNVNLRAVFAPMVRLSVDQSDGGTITVTAEKTQYLSGDLITASAQVQEGYRFQGWTGALAGQPATASVVLSNDLTLAASYLKLQKIVLTQTREGTVTALDGLYHADGESSTILAQAAQGWTFACWQGAASGTNNPVAVVVGTNTVLNAVFQRLFTLAVNATQGGAVVVNPEQAAYADGTLVTLTATADKYYRFDACQGDLKGTNSSTTIALATNLVIGALFTPAHRLVIASNQNLKLGFKLRLEGEPGVQYVIEASSALLSRTPVATITSQTGIAEFVDQQATALSERFYRLRTGN